ncbi:sulfatase [Humibacillus sp. DSM 29435]|uniref:sulfatase family protein n=1 Tax=Humibacillus sp. DSM 29435 TaxID=1869167 RepID=UPI000AA76D72|nr:sulfatase-like hydrolase/transferase [Humibacillus sp. DSM 29435]
MGTTGDHSPPDVLLVYTDQWRWDALGCAGWPVLTPNLDRLAADGVRFSRAVVQSPVCMPSRVSMLTGRLPSDLRITRMGIPVPPDTRTIADLLGHRGWHTATIGKLHFLPHANRDHAQPHPSYGFDTLVISDEPGVYEDDYRAWLRRIAPEALDQLPTELPPAAAVWQNTLGHVSDDAQATTGRDDFADAHVFAADESLTHSAWVATRTIDHLQSLPPGQRAFTIASFFSPHAPYRVPQRFYDLYDRSTLPLSVLAPLERSQAAAAGLTEERLRAIRHGYFAACSEVDFHVGRILRELDRLGRAENTLVVFLADHGEWLGDHARLAKGFPADDPVSRVPLIVRWPGHTIGGHVVEAVVEALDIVPTLLEACGVPAPPELQGDSLVPMLRGARLDRPEVAITEHDDWTSIRSATHHYLVTAGGDEMLWDLSADPGEYEDVAAEAAQAGELARHRGLLLARLLRARRTLPRTWPY